MGQIFEAMERFFRDRQTVARIAGEPALHFWVDGASGRWSCVAQAREEEQQVLLYSVCPHPVPPPKRPAMAEFLTRANWGLVIGNFELDWDGGGVRFKTSLDLEGDRLSDALMKAAVTANLVTMDRYLPGIVAVLQTEIDPAAAVSRIEGGLPPTIS